ncbi:hypothetical protein [Nonomuraea sp. NPDC049309]|uniref:hypothetical protein n=1 Tax=Nonomuraea sp. NPDC049309 TaxID=3364350 RepID=UPI003711DE5B
MWIRGTVRLLAALLGIQITIIAPASAASAATRPEWVPAPGSLHGPGGWEHNPALPALADAYEIGPRAAARWAYKRLFEARTRLSEAGDWPSWDESAQDGFWDSHDPAAIDAMDSFTARPAPIEAWPAPIEARPAQTKAHPAAPKAKQKARPGARKAKRERLRSRAARIPRTRAHAAHRRAQVDLARVLPRRASVTMSHTTAASWLRYAGVQTKSTGHCTSKHLRHCTSLDRIRTGTLAKIIELKQDSGCPILVTGGTERGHAPGVYSHGNGYKLDIAHNSCIDRYIHKHYDRSGIRSDGARLYKGHGAVFADEGDHWDILFR